MKTAHCFIPARLPASLFTVVFLLYAVTFSIAVAAEAPQAEGFYRMMVGDFEVTALSDGTTKRPVEQMLQLLNGDKEKLKDGLARAYPDGQGEIPVNAFLINTGSKLVLIDAGNGKMGSPTMGKVIDNLRAAGYQPEKIDEIYLTHMHGDHLGGLVAGTERAFPKATVYADEREAEFWLSDSNQRADLKRNYQAVKTALTPYINAGKFKTFDGDTRLIPGIRAQALYGHTPGHTAYFIESQGKTLALWGDIVHVGAVQFEDPSVTLSFDIDKTEAAQTRQQILAAAAKNGWLIGGAHLALPGIGHVQTDQDNGYIFLPVDDPASK